MFRVHAILNNSAGAVKATKNRGPGYCYRLPEFPSSNFVGYNTGLFFLHLYKILSSTYCPNTRLIKIFRKIIPEETMPLVVLVRTC